MKKSLFQLITILLFFPFPTFSAEVQKTFISNQELGLGDIEVYYAVPKEKGSFPVLFLLHGHQDGETTPGGKQYFDLGYVDRFLNMGIFVVCPSIPGFGASQGRSDLWGPYSQKAILEVIKHFKAHPQSNANKMGLYGISKGACLGSMVCAQTSDLLFQILEAGQYNLYDRYINLPNYLYKLTQSIETKTDLSDQAFQERSAVYHAKSYKGKTLLLHGEWDDRRGQDSAILLHKELLKENKSSVLKIFKDSTHILGHEKWEDIIPFVRKEFFDQYGIGINISAPIPAMQITKIQPDSPADKSGKLRVGDAILAISPLNDDQEYSTINMPIPEFISLVLGEAKTEVRLKVQHFDLSIEEIVLTRF